MARVVFVLAALASGCFIKPDPPGTPPNGGVPPNIAFVTSNARPVTEITSIAFADQWCMEAAGAASLEGTFKAWLSSATENARDRLGSARGWVRVDGKPFIDLIEDALLAKRMYYPLRIDENGNDIITSLPPVIHWAATGTNDMGIVDRPLTGTSTNDCGGYTGTGAIRAGYPDGAGREWTAGTLLNCSSTLMMHVYCLQTDRVSEVDAPIATGRRIFASGTPMPAGAGLAAFDSRCMADAVGASLTGEFRAAVATSTMSALERVGGPQPWTRVDGVEATSDLMEFQAPINVTAAAVYLEEGGAWNGAMTPIALGTETCFDWTMSVPDEFGRVGDIARSTSAGFGATQTACNSANTVYCVER